MRTHFVVRTRVNAECFRRFASALGISLLVLHSVYLNSDFVGTKLFALVGSQNLLRAPLRAPHTIKFYEDKVFGWCVIWGLYSLFGIIALPQIPTTLDEIRHSVNGTTSTPHHLNIEEKRSFSTPILHSQLSILNLNARRSFKSRTLHTAFYRGRSRSRALREARRGFRIPQPCRRLQRLSCRRPLSWKVCER